MVILIEDDEPAYAKQLRTLFLGTMEIKDIEELESHFATLTPKGWVLPEWLINLRAAIEEHHATRLH